LAAVNSVFSILPRSNRAPVSAAFSHYPLQAGHFQKYSINNRKQFGTSAATFFR
jgi:hypothetical protein